MIQSFTFGPFATNTYLADSILVDCACMQANERERLSLALEQMGITPTMLIATHGHLDHLWGAKWASEKWNLPILIAEPDFIQVEHLAQQQASFGIPPFDTEFSYRKLAQEDLDGTGFQLIETPGHTQGSICLYNPEQKILLSGDTLFDGGYGRTDLPGGDYHQLVNSLELIGKKIPTGTRVYPGHGNCFTL